MTCRLTARPVLAYDADRDDPPAAVPHLTAEQIHRALATLSPAARLIVEGWRRDLELAREEEPTDA